MSLQQAVHEHSASGDDTAEMDGWLRDTNTPAGIAVLDASILHQFCEHSGIVP